MAKAMRIGNDAGATAKPQSGQAQTKTPELLPWEQLGRRLRKWRENVILRQV